MIKAIMNYNTIILSLFLICSLQCYSQDSKKVNHLIGGNLGMTSGIGFSYQLSGDTFGWQTTGFYLFESKFYSRANIGSMVLHKFYKTDKFYLFNYLSGHIRTFKSDHSSFSKELDGYTIKTKIDHHLHVGFGHGIAFKINKRLVYNLQLGYGLFNLQKRNPQTFLTAETSLLFRINKL